MNSITLLQPPRIVFGEGCSTESAGVLAGLGARRVLIVTSTPLLGMLEPMLEAQRRAGMQPLLAPPVDREPDVALFETVLQQARTDRADAVLAVGGGSAMDVGKLVAALARSEQSVAAVFGLNRLAGRALPLICLPTTSGTGSEVSPNAILLDAATGLKQAVISPHLVPDAALVDPRLTHGVPAETTAATGFDALTHCLEAYANKAAHPTVDLHAIEGVRLIGSHLGRAVRNGADAEARAALALGSLYGGLCLGPVNTAAVHALAYPLGSRFHVPHGLSNAVLLAPVLRFNLAAAPERYADIAVALGVERETSALATAGRGVDRLADLARECGIPDRLSAIGIPRSALPDLARMAMQVQRLLKNNPRPVSEPDAMAIYESVY